MLSIFHSIFNNTITYLVTIVAYIIKGQILLFLTYINAHISPFSKTRSLNNNNNNNNMVIVNILMMSVITPCTAHSEI